MIIFFMIILIFIGVIVVIFLLPTSEHLKVPLAMLVSLILLIFLILYRPRILYYLESIMFFRLLENQGPLLKNVQPLESVTFIKKISDFGFALHLKTKEFTIYSCYAKDKKQNHLRRPMLLIYVLIHEDNITYQNKKIVQEINKLEDSLYKNKKRIVNYTVFIAKQGPKLTSAIKKACNQVSHSRVGQRYVININIYHETTTNSAYFLYSDNYAPNSFYRYAVNLLKDFIS